MNNADLHGMVPDKSDVVLILLDVLNDLEFEGGERIVEYALPMADKIAALKTRAKKAGIPVVYVNDNYGRWQSDMTKLVAHCLEGNTRGRPMVERLKPEEDDYFVLKPKHSGFYSTTLDVLLDYLQARTLIITGLAGNICVLYTANDAYMRDMNLVVPSDCTASNDPKDNEYALHQMQTFLKADISPSDRLDFNALKRHASEERAPENPSRQFATR